MPFYDLRCPICERDYTISATMAEKTEKHIPCPDCGSFDLETVYKGAPAYLKNRGENSCPNRHGCGSACSRGYR